MTKDEHNNLLYKLIAIDRMYIEGKHKQAHQAQLKIIVKLITEIYEMQNKEA